MPAGGPFNLLEFNLAIVRAIFSQPPLQQLHYRAWLTVRWHSQIKPHFHARILPDLRMLTVSFNLWDYFTPDS